MWVRLFTFALKPFIGMGLERIPFIPAVYQFITKAVLKNSITLVEVHNQKMYVDAAFGITLKASGTYLSERLMTEVFLQQLKEGMTVVDVGAHVGYYTLLAARAVGKDGSVFSFEPEPSVFTLLVKNIDVNGYKNVEAINKAVMDTSGVVGLYVNDVSGSHSMVNRKAKQKPISIVAVSLDDYFCGRTVDVMKIDVEGAEMSVLKGMGSTLPRKMFIEFAPTAIRKSGFTPSEFIDILYGYGYKIQVINENNHTLEPIDRVIELCKGNGCVNLFCWRSLS